MTEKETDRFPWGMLAPSGMVESLGQLEEIIPAEHMRRCLIAAESSLADARAHGDSHLDYFCGRFYGQPREQVARPLNLIAQTVNAYVPELVPRQLSHDPRPRRGGLGMEAQILGRLLEINDEELDLCGSVYDEMVPEAMFYAMSVSYTGLKVPSVDSQGRQINGRPFTIHVPFHRWVCDPFAETFKTRQWEGHSFRVSRKWLLKQPAFQDPETQQRLATIPAWEDSGEGQRAMRTSMVALSGGRDSALFDTVELYNIVVYHESGVWEGTMTKEEHGEDVWLRASPWHGDREGPYDHLIFRRVPGQSLPIAILSHCRDIAEAADASARKDIDAKLNSKIVGSYEAGKETEAEAVARAPHGGMVKVADQNTVKMHNMALFDGSWINATAWMKQEWNDASGQAQLVAGADTNDPTLGQAEIRASQASKQVEYLVGKVSDLTKKHARKRGHFFLNDPVADHRIAFEMEAPDQPGGRDVMVIRWGAHNRDGAPEDYEYDCQPSMIDQGGPQMRSMRILQGMDTVARMMPLFQMGLFSLSKTLRMLDRNGAAGIEEIANDAIGMEERMAADMAVQQELGGGMAPMQPMGGGRPSVAGPTAPGPRIGRPSSTQRGARQQSRGRAPAMGA